MTFEEKPIVYVSGKGGVGKSLISAVLAHRAAQRGSRVLLAELGDQSYFADFFGLESVDYQPRSVPGLGFDVALWNGESCLHEYVLHYLKSERIFRMFFENRVMKTFLGVAPAVDELAMTGKITSRQRKVGPELLYDQIIVDGFATGHSLALVRAPLGMAEAVRHGPMGKESRAIFEVMSDPKETAYVLVTLLEELPVRETLEFRGALKDLTGINPVLIGNKVLEAPVSYEELVRLRDALDEPGLKEFAAYLTGQHERQNQFIDELNRVGSEFHVLPLTFESTPTKMVRQLGGRLRKL